MNKATTDNGDIYILCDGHLQQLIHHIPYGMTFKSEPHSGSCEQCKSNQQYRDEQEDKLTNYGDSGF